MFVSVAASSWDSIIEAAKQKGVERGQAIVVLGGVHSKEENEIVKRSRVQISGENEGEGEWKKDPFVTTTALPLRSSLFTIHQGRSLTFEGVNIAVTNECTQSLFTLVSRTATFSTVSVSSIPLARDSLITWGANARFETKETCFSSGEPRERDCHVVEL